MIHYNKRSQLLAVALAALAGFVDALGFLHSGGYFASFMSGNSTKFAVGLVGDRATAAVAAGLIGLFVLGAIAGEFVARVGGARRAVFVLMAVSLLLLLAASLAKAGREDVAAVLMVLAMGAENAVFHRNGDVSIGLTYMTGTLVKFAQRLVAAILGGDRWGWLPYGLLWCGLVGGAVAGAALYQAWRLDALWVAAAASVILTGCAALLPGAARQAIAPEGA